MAKKMSKVVSFVDPENFNAGDPTKVKELRKASKKEACVLVEKYVSARGTKKIVDVDDFAKKVINDTGTTLSFSSIKDACFEAKKKLKKQKDRTFQRAVDLAVNKLNEGFDFQQVLAHFASVLPYTCYSDVAELSTNAKWAAINKAQEIREKKLAKEVAESDRKRSQFDQDFRRPLARALKQVVTT